MKLNEVLGIWDMINKPQIIEKIEKIEGVKFSYAFEKNSDKLRSEIMSFAKQRDKLLTDELKELLNKKELSEDELRKRLQLVQEFENSEGFKELLDVDCEISIHYIKPDNLPSNITNGTYKHIKWMVSEGE